MTPEAEARFERIEAGLAEATAITISNARAIEAVVNQQVVVQREIAQFVRAVAEYSEVTDRRLTALENKP